MSLPLRPVPEPAALRVLIDVMFPSLWARSQLTARAKYSTGVEHWRCGQPGLAEVAQRQGLASAHREP